MIMRWEIDKSSFAVKREPGSVPEDAVCVSTLNSQAYFNPQASAWASNSGFASPASTGQSITPKPPPEQHRAYGRGAGPRHGTQQQ